MYLNYRIQLEHLENPFLGEVSEALGQITGGGCEPSIPGWVLGQLRHASAVFIEAQFLLVLEKYRTREVA